VVTCNGGWRSGVAVALTGPRRTLTNLGVTLTDSGGTLINGD
jgi:hypothetical protein